MSHVLFKNILLAPDSFKGSLEAKEVCQAMTKGIHAWNKNIHVRSFPISDGGEGFARYLTQINRSQNISCRVKNPLHKITQANFGWQTHSKTAYIDMASASGLTLIKPTAKSSIEASSYGTGELIKKALDLGARHVILGLGGSATTDMGAGMANALGYRFLDRTGKNIRPCGANLNLISSIDTTQRDERLTQTSFLIACDVQNPLYGKYGAAQVYAPQKGATPKEVSLLDKGLAHLNALIHKTNRLNLNRIKGAGAAGGLAAGSIYFLNGKLTSGIDLFFDLTNLKQHLLASDLIITGEGRIDDQTLQGKAILGLAKLANENNIPICALCGACNISLAARKKLPIDYLTSIISRPMLLKTALKKELVQQALIHTTYEIIRLMHANTINSKKKIILITCPLKLSLSSSTSCTLKPPSVFILTKKNASRT